ncbi:hypothetical protein JMUB6875_35370 [Nocardia sp. JMUB6875]|uniref:hypothetical protein n=1 Tax=Nocardia sp. JMUB6875 TaxID=3158170 RepID=UPI0032E79505
MTAPTPDAQPNSADSQPTSPESTPIPPQASPVPVAAPPVQAPLPYYASTGLPPQYHPPQPSSPGRAIIPWVIAAAVAVLGIAGTVTSSVLYSGEKNTSDDLRAQLSASQLSSEATAAQQAACDVARLIGTYDYTNVDQTFDALLAASTGDLRKDFVTTRAALKDRMVSQQVHNKLSEIHCGLASLGNRKAEVIVVVKQATTNLSAPTPTEQTVPMTMTVDEQPDGRWLASQMSTLK